MVHWLSVFFLLFTHTLSQSFFFSHFILSDRWRLPSRHLVYPVCTLPRLPLGPQFAHILRREKVYLYYIHTLYMQKMFLYYGFQAQGIVYFYNEFLQHFEIFLLAHFHSQQMLIIISTAHNKKDENYGYAKRLQYTFAKTKQLINGSIFLFLVFVVTVFVEFINL